MLETGLTCSRTWLYQNSGDPSNRSCSTSTNTLKILIHISAINEVSSYGLKLKISILLLELLLSFNTGHVTVVLMFPLRSSQRSSEYFIYVCVHFSVVVFYVSFFKHSLSTGNTRFIPSGQHSSEKLAFKGMRKMRQILKREQAQLCICLSASLWIMLFQNKYC